MTTSKQCMPPAAAAGRPVRLPACDQSQHEATRDQSVTRRSRCKHSPADRKSGGFFASPTAIKPTDRPTDEEEEEEEEEATGWSVANKS